MTTTTAETVTVDGLTLNTLAYNIETLAGRLSTPDVRTKNIELAGRHGTIRIPGKKFQQGQFILSMWVRGANPDGSIPNYRTGRRLFFDNLDLLSQVFTRKSGKLDIRQSRSDGTVRQCFGEVLAVVDFSSKTPHPMAKFSVAVVIPEVFWQDLNALTFTSPAGLVASQVITLTPFIGATAPMEDLVWTVVGAATNAKIQALENTAPLEVDTWMQYTGTIPNLDQLVVDSGVWGVSGVGFSPSTANLVHSGSTRFMSLPPGVQNTAPQIQWSAAGVGANTQLIVSGRRKYVVV